MTNPAAQSQSLTDRFLDSLADVLRRRHETDGPAQKWLRRARWLGFFGTVAYVLSLVVILWFVEWKAEAHWLTSFLLYLPPQGWLLPLVLLTPWCFLFHRTSCWAHLWCVIWVFCVFMKPQLGAARSASGHTVKLVSNNVGQSGGQNFVPFMLQEQPDFILLQEAGSGKRIARSFTNYTVSVQSEFTLLSKHPIKAATLLPIRSIFSEAIAARYEVDFKGQPLVIYNIHLTSPRRDLENMRGLGLAAALFGGEEGHGRKIRQLTTDFWKRQLEDAEAVAGYIRKETGPVIIAGDFNSPDHGVVYQKFSSEWTDAFRACGSGYGFTFPGFTRNPITLFGPWLRLDYAYAGKGVQPVECRVEPDRRSQHRTLVAAFEIQSASK